MLKSNARVQTIVGKRCQIRSQLTEGKVLIYQNADSDQLEAKSAQKLHIFIENKNRGDNIAAQ